MTVTLAAIAMLLAACSSPAGDTPVDPVDYVSTLVGTQSSYELSCGNTYPAVSLPWGMNVWTPQTGENNDGWIYTYDSNKIRGFRQTHQPSPWIKDYGAFSLMPLKDASKPREKERQSVFSHLSETAKPYYYGVYLADQDVKAEMTATERAAIMRFTFPESQNSGIVIDAFDGGSYVDILPDYQTILGYCTNNNGGVEGNFQNWFAIQFDKPATSFDIYDGDKCEYPEKRQREHSMLVVKFSTFRGEQVHARVASSFISADQAFQNLKEVEAFTFEEISDAARNRWNEELSRIEVSGGSIDQYRTFYSCLYRCLQFPRMFYEIGENGEAVHYSPFSGKTEKGVLYTDTGFWDSFRALFPLLNLVYPDVSKEIMAGYANVARENLFLPEWASPGHRSCMVGNSSASV
ncbi:MAG: GH92 family glycosyl hydrolase, partial [Bacteroidales bacterium]|nr:GH92 family glycosyl hydrolase [Bacteroidales bacterium]